MKRQEYEKLLVENLTANYHKAKNSVINEINEEARIIAEKLELEDKINVMPLKNAYITLKDHKENFRSSPKCRLINPTKSELGKISKLILENINKQVRQKTRFMQWTNSEEVIEWFKGLEKDKYEFIKFDVVEFYPSITEELVDKAMTFATKYVEIDDEETNIIKHSTKSILVNNNTIWKKKHGPNGSLFDVTMGGFHGAELCELVGLYMMEGLTKIIPPKNIGIYRDDGLAVIEKQKRQVAENTKKKIYQYAKSIGLRITIENPVSETDFLDLDLNLKDHTFSPYKKPNNELRYVSNFSNHPKTILTKFLR